MPKRKKRRKQNLNWEAHSEKLMLSINLNLMPVLDLPQETVIDALACHPESFGKLDTDMQIRILTADAILSNAARQAFQANELCYRYGHSNTHLVVSLRGVLGLRDTIDIAVLPPSAPFAPQWTATKELDAYVFDKPAKRLLLTFGALPESFADEVVEILEQEPWESLPAHGPRQLDIFLKHLLKDFIKLQATYDADNRPSQRVVALGCTDWLPKTFTQANFHTHGNGGDNTQ